MKRMVFKVEWNKSNMNLFIGDCIKTMLKTQVDFLRPILNYDYLINVSKSNRVTCMKCTAVEGGRETT